MIQLLIEENNFDGMMFTIMFPVNLSTPSLQCVEDWYISKDTLRLKSKATGSDMKELRSTLDTLMLKYVVPTIRDIHSEPRFSNMSYEIQESYHGGSLAKRNSELSYSYYLDIRCNVDSINCCEDIKTKLNIFKIRLSNHLSPQELAAIAKNDNAKFYTIWVDDLTETTFRKQVTNVCEAYQKFIQSLTDLNTHVEKFTDIPEDILQIVKSVILQKNN